MPSKCTAAHLLVRPQGHDFARQRDKRGSRELTVGVQDGNTFQEGRFVVPVSVEPGLGWSGWCTSLRRYARRIL